MRLRSRSKLAVAKFRVYRVGVTAAIPDSGFVPLDGREFDPSGMLVPEGRVAIPESGDWEFEWMLCCSVVLAADNWMFGGLIKNGAAEADGTIVYQRGVNALPRSGGATRMFCTAGDRVGLLFRTNNGATTITGGPDQTYLAGRRVS